MARATLRPARPEDVPAIEDLLKAESLPPLEIREWLETFWVIERDARVLGCAGIELYGESSVLRSVAVDPALRGAGEGMNLVQRALDEAKRRGARRAYLFTASAAGFFERFGFRACAVEDFDFEARQSWQWRFLSTNEAARNYVTAMQADL